MWSLRRRLIATLCSGALLCAGAGHVFGQTIQPSPNGSEILLQPSGLGAFPITLNHARATTSYQLSSATSGTVTANALTNRVIFTTATLGSLTLNAPANPPDGSMLEIVNGTGAAFTTGVTLATTDGSTLVGAAASGALAAGASVEWQFTGASKVWYKLR
jgi:hypothetical protein